MDARTRNSHVCGTLIGAVLGAALVIALGLSKPTIIAKADSPNSHFTITQGAYSNPGGSRSPLSTVFRLDSLTGEGYYATATTVGKLSSGQDSNRLQWTRVLDPRP